MSVDTQFALNHAPAAVRPALDALWRLDATFGSVLATGSEAPGGGKMISRIRLAWWREALERLDNAPPPAQPLLEALAADVLTRGVSGAQMGEMEAGWIVLTDPPPLSDAELMTYAEGRGRLFVLSARLLGGEVPAAAGQVFALADLARRTRQWEEAERIAALAPVDGLPRRWAKAVRPLGMLAVLAARDLKRPPEQWEPYGAPPRRARMMRLGLLGW